MPDSSSVPLGPQGPVERFNPPTSFRSPSKPKEVHYPHASYDALLPHTDKPLPVINKDTLAVSRLPKSVASGTFASTGLALPAGDVTIGDARQPLYVMLPPDVLSTGRPQSVMESTRPESGDKTLSVPKSESSFNLWAMLNRLVTTPMARTWTFFQRWTGRFMGNILAPFGRVMASWIEKANDWAVKPVANAIGRGVSWALSKGKAVLDTLLVDTPRAAFQAVKRWVNTLVGR